MRKEITELNESIEDIGDAVTETAISSVDVTAQLANLPWQLIRAITEETGGLIDEIMK